MMSQTTLSTWGGFPSSIKEMVEREREIEGGGECLERLCVTKNRYSDQEPQEFGFSGRGEAGTGTQHRKRQKAG